MIDAAMQVLGALVILYFIIGVLLTFSGYVVIWIGRDSKDRRTIKKAGIIMNVIVFILTAITIPPIFISNVYERHRLNRKWKVIERKINDNKENKTE